MAGDLTVSKAGLLLSTGLDVRLIATKNTKVQYANGSGQSSVDFHEEPDGAAVFEKEDCSGNYFYTSNAESIAAGGVGSIEFDSNGGVVGYERVLEGKTKRNCGGGRSPYNTWLSCEENVESGFVWEVSPSGAFAGRVTQLVPEGGNYESVAYQYNASLGGHVYYITEDKSDGPLVQFTPSENLNTPDEMYSTGTHRFLRLSGSGNSGSFSWVLNKADANPRLYPDAEGIDIKDGFVYFVSKTTRMLFILNLSTYTFQKETTAGGPVSTPTAFSYCMFQKADLFVTLSFVVRLLVSRPA